MEVYNLHNWGRWCWWNCRLKILREPLDHTGNELPPDRHIGGSGQDIKIKNDKYMPSVMNMMIMFHVQKISAGMMGKAYKWCLTAHLDMLTGFLLSTKLLKQIFSTVAKMCPTRWLKMKKSKWNPHVPLCGREC